MANARSKMEVRTTTTLTKMDKAKNVFMNIEKSVANSETMTLAEKNQGYPEPTNMDEKSRMWSPTRSRWWLRRIGRMVEVLRVVNSDRSDRNSWSFLTGQQLASGFEPLKSMGPAPQVSWEGYRSNVSASATLSKQVRRGTIWHKYVGISPFRYCLHMRRCPCCSLLNNMTRQKQPHGFALWKMINVNPSLPNLDTSGGYVQCGDMLA